MRRILAELLPLAAAAAMLVLPTWFVWVGGAR